MNIIICGAGRVGFTIAKLLVEQNHSITVIDQSSEDIQKINDSLDVKAIVGKATYPTVLEKANAQETDMIIAVTKNDEINMLICQIAYTIWVYRVCLCSLKILILQIFGFIMWGMCLPDSCDSQSATELVKLFTNSEGHYIIHLSKRYVKNKMS